MFNNIRQKSKLRSCSTIFDKNRSFETHKHIHKISTQAVIYFCSLCVKECTTRPSDKLHESLATRSRSLAETRTCRSIFYCKFSYILKRMMPCAPARQIQANSAEIA